MIRSATLSLIKGYQIWLSPMKLFFGATGGTCRFTPTCSEYAIGAVEQHGVLKGLFLGTCRILRCQPWGGQGYDPVPLKTQKKQQTRQPCACCSPSKPLEHFHG